MTVARRKTSITLDARSLDAARDLAITVSAVAEAALVKAIADARPAAHGKRGQGDDVVRAVDVLLGRRVTRPFLWARAPLDRLVLHC
ncbi:MAG: type II toxin-antitoxin system CcdA family antitoxin [Amaricoccus sp.]